MDEKTKKEIMFVVNPYTNSTFEMEIKKERKETRENLTKYLKLIDRAYRTVRERKT
jgi:hypothetical protein